jgi:hypothetical protein
VREDVGELADDPTELGVELAMGDADAVELDELTIQLRRELLQLDVESVERRYEGEPPENTRAIEVAALGALVVKVAPSVLSVVVRVVQSWAASRPNRTAALKIDGDSIELTGISSEQQQALIDAFIVRHGAA